MPYVFAELTGKRFGRLLVVRQSGRSTSGQIRWRCRCDCGKEVDRQSYDLRSGDVKSCGCLRRESLAVRRRYAGIAKPPDARRKHGGAQRSGKDNRYGIWSGLIQRCTNPAVVVFKLYGGRGIKVCDRWRVGEHGKTAFECFAEDMGSRPSSQHSIDRYPDNDGHYEPGNCRWATRKEQERNKRPRMRGLLPQRQELPA